MLTVVRVKGDAVTETSPYLKYFVQKSTHKPLSIVVKAYADGVSNVAPIRVTDNVKWLCTIEANVSTIPDENIEKRVGHDGQTYYYMEGHIEIACESPLMLLPSPTSMTNYKDR